MENCEYPKSKRRHCGKLINEGLPLTINGEQIYVCFDCWVGHSLKEAGLSNTRRLYGDRRKD